MSDTDKKEPSKAVKTPKKVVKKVIEKSKYTFVKEWKTKKKTYKKGDGLPNDTHKNIIEYLTAKRYIK